MPYPSILGNGVAGLVEEVGPLVTNFKKGDRVVSDTPIYQLKQTKYGCWQKYVVGTETTTAMIPENTTFEDAAAIPFALLTAVAALHLKLGMGKANEHRGGKALIWSASGSVGGYAVQYAASVSEMFTYAGKERVDINIRMDMTLWQQHRRGNLTTCVVLVRARSWTTKMTRLLIS